MWRRRKRMAKWLKLKRKYSGNEVFVNTNLISVVTTNGVGVTTILVGNGELEVEESMDDIWLLLTTSIV